MDYIPNHHYLDDAPNSLEDSPVRIDHVDCGAGTDTKGRLYIWRKADQSVSAYCHNCGMSGYSKSKHHTRNIHRLRPKKSSRPVRNLHITLPRDLEKDVKKWPVEARAWVYSAGLTNEEVMNHGLGYSNWHRRVIIPCLSSTGSLSGYQTRKIFEDGRPKYLTRSKVGKKLLFTDVFTHDPSDTLCVVVEDALSCIKVGRTHHSVALMGCSSNDQVLKYLTNHYKHVIIFLDNDNSEVMKKQEQIRRDLDMLMETVTVIRHDKDPKECTTLELGALLK